MKTLMLTYLLLGILLNFLGPLAKRIREEIDELNADLRAISFADKLLDRKPIPSWKKIAFEIILRLLCLTAYPILYIVLVIDYFRSKREIKQTTDYKTENYLYYRHVGGSGTIHCNTCGFSEKFIGFLHGFGPNSWNSSGFQCQACGKFHGVEYDMNNSKGRKCECGGDLSREKPIFCPECKSKNMHYDMEYIT